MSARESASDNCRRVPGASDLEVFITAIKFRLENKHFPNLLNAIYFYIFVESI